jgi:hypothetical protein
LTTSFDIDILDYSNASKSIYYEVIKDGEIYINRTTTDKNNTLIKILKPKPGTYTIRYTVKDENKNWSCIKSYSFIVLPIWWQTTWFNALLIICFLALLLLFIWRIQVYYKRKAEKQLKVEMHLFELESQNILAQLKPHFIFNILTPLQNYFLND